DRGLVWRAMRGEPDEPGGERREASGIAVSGQLEVAGPLVAVNVLRQIDRRETGQMLPLEYPFGPPDPGRCGRRELAARARIAESVRPLAVEADTVALHVQPGSHPISRLRRRLHCGTIT